MAGRPAVAGTAFLGLGGGALLALASADDSDSHAVLLWFSVALMLVGVALTAVGGTAKWLRP